MKIRTKIKQVLPKKEKVKKIEKQSGLKVRLREKDTVRYIELLIEGKKMCFVKDYFLEEDLERVYKKIVRLGKRFPERAFSLVRKNLVPIEEADIKQEKDFIYTNLMEATKGLSVTNVKTTSQNGVDVLSVDINGRPYEYVVDELGGLSFEDLCSKFKKMMSFSPGKAVSWLKRVAVLVPAGKEEKKRYSIGGFSKRYLIIGESISEDRVFTIHTRNKDIKVKFDEAIDMEEVYYNYKLKQAESDLKAILFLKGKAVSIERV